MLIFGNKLLEFSSEFTFLSHTLLEVVKIVILGSENPLETATLSDTVTVTSSCQGHNLTRRMIY